MDHYEILGVSPSASDGVILAAYRQRLKEVHPDTGHDDGAELNAVKRAGDVLLTQHKRAAYDADLAAAHRYEDDSQSRALGLSNLRIAGGLIAASLVAIAAIFWGPMLGSDETASDQSPVIVAGVAGGTLETNDGPPADDEVISPDETLGVTATPEPEAQPTEAPTAEPTAEPTPIPTAVQVEAEPTVAPTPAPAESAESQVEAETDDGADTDSDSDTQTETDDTSDTDDTDDTDDTESTEALPSLDDLPERGAIYRAPTLFLVGPVPSQEIADAFYAKAVAVLGEENVVNEYVVHPDAPTDLNGNVRVEQAIQFETASATIRPEFIPVLGLAFEVLTQNPQASLVIAGHTDSIGTAELNLALSEARASAVVDWLAERGIDRSRLSAVGFGESVPIADNLTEAGRAINRRIEVEITDLLS